MCKPPIPGVSKTRLATVLGQDHAARLAAAFLADSAALARQLATREAAALTGFFTPPDAGAAMAAMLPGWALEAQSGGDLGARMGHAIGRIFAAGATRALLLGTDAPTLPPALLELLLAALSSGADAALIPALDGGYCAIAVARPLPALLEDMPWSTPALLDATRARATREGLRLDVLQAWHDVDEAEDLALLRLTLDGAALPGCSPLPGFRANATRGALDG
ncbi:TIGR04282 family arsenosugar biosynthesis glycosyltransferase [Sediminicoccus sp. KRV36]|uniref:TIGR04282 family arsenosugar biosynthesis glycosyltransferase n=1 Tax=Sediminicoccus sp. KRV36 TaxID=3133721 RepID=UPI00200C480E|nr:TIGR04282 family arsenosugar biosynthesis glycosyltransferase [Sediminicoccus rosea]UPY39243.1 TIGR04282 family arsenosugar biosynthesis glycosyltransferase [Sediminicoccus rosea]